MGAANSTPPPLVQVHAPGGKVLVPSGTAFTVHPPYTRSRTSPHTPMPMYTPYPSLRRGNGTGPRMRARQHTHPGAGWPSGDIIEGSEGDDDTTVADGMDGGVMGVRGLGTRTRGNTGGGMGGRNYFEPRPRSVPARGEAYSSGTHYARGLSSSPAMLGSALWTSGLNGVQTAAAGGGGGMMNTGLPKMRSGIADMQQQAPPPEYTLKSNCNLTRYGGAGGEMQGAQGHPYVRYSPGLSPAGALSSTSTSTSTSTSARTSTSPPPPPLPPHATRRRRRRQRREYYAHVPMGAYADAKTAPQASRSRSETQTTTRLDRRQALREKVGATTGEEWIQGDGFLDACTCTTNCDCRKSQRVLYRVRHERRRKSHSHGDDSDDDGEQHDYCGSGEIRYILKDDLGRDCGEHTGCGKSDDSESEEKGKRKKNIKAKEKKEDKKRRQQFKGLKEDLLEALDERLQDMTKASRQRDVEFGSPAPRPSLGVRGLGQTSYNNMMNGPGRDARIMAQPLGGMGNPYGMATTPRLGPMLPPGIMTDNGPMHPPPPPDMSMGMAGFQDDVSEMDAPGPSNMGNANMQYGMMNKKTMRPNFMSPRGAKAGRQFGGGAMGMDMDRMAAMYSQAMGSRGGILGHRGSGQLDSESDDFDSGIRQRPGLERNGRGGRGLGHGDKDSPNRRDFGGSPLGGNNSSRDRGKQARVDTDDDDAY